jgi:hypothetical protein
VTADDGTPFNLIPSRGQNIPAFAPLQICPTHDDSESSTSGLFTAFIDVTPPDSLIPPLIDDDTVLSPSRDDSEFSIGSLFAPLQEGSRHPVPIPPIDDANVLSPSRDDSEFSIGSLFAPLPEGSPHARPLVGLVNQGTTCYLNSVVQFLFHLPIFRSFVYSLINPPGVPFQLQQLFGRMQLRPGPCQTTCLTAAITWNNFDLEEHQDAHEFLRLLFNDLQRPTGDDHKGPPLDGGHDREPLLH